MRPRENMGEKGETRERMREREREREREKERAREREREGEREKEEDWGRGRARERERARERNPFEADAEINAGNSYLFIHSYTKLPTTHHTHSNTVLHSITTLSAVAAMGQTLDNSCRRENIMHRKG